MAIIFKQDCAACVDTPGSNRTTMYIDNTDGKLTIIDSEGIISKVSCGSSFDNLAFGNGSDGCCHITLTDADCQGHAFMCAGKYNLTNFIVDEGVTLYFCGCDTVELKISNCFCNMGIINTRGTIVCPNSSNIFLIGGVSNVQNIGTLGAFVESGCSYCYCNGGNGCGCSYSYSGSGTVGGNSYWCNGGAGGSASNPANGGCSYYGSGGAGGSSGSSNYPRYNNASGGNSYAGDGGAGGTGGCDCPTYYGYGGSSVGGAYGLYIGAPKVYNNCIYAKGGNGGWSGNADRCGCGTNGGDVLIAYRDCLCNCGANVQGGTGKNMPQAGTLTIVQIPSCF